MLYNAMLCNDNVTLVESRVGLWNILFKFQYNLPHAISATGSLFSDAGFAIYFYAIIYCQYSSSMLPNTVEGAPRAIRPDQTTVRVGNLSS